MKIEGDPLNTQHAVEVEVEVEVGGEAEAVFIRGSITNEDPPNAHQEEDDRRVW